jgi:hypothetical protein
VARTSAIAIPESAVAASQTSAGSHGSRFHAIQSTLPTPARPRNPISHRPKRRRPDPGRAAIGQLWLAAANSELLNSAPGSSEKTPLYAPAPVDNTRVAGTMQAVVTSAAVSARALVGPGCRSAQRSRQASPATTGGSTLALVMEAAAASTAVASSSPLLPVASQRGTDVASPVSRTRPQTVVLLP